MGLTSQWVKIVWNIDLKTLWPSNLSDVSLGELVIYWRCTPYHPVRLHKGEFGRGDFRYAYLKIEFYFGRLTEIYFESI